MFNKLIARNTSIPTSKTETFSTGVDNQTQVVIKVLQGERPIASDNQLLGEFVLMGIPPGPKGKPQIAVTFNIDADGIVRVSAVDKSSGREERIEVRSTGGLTPQQVEALVAEASAQKAVDAQRQQRLQVVAECDIVVQDVESNVEQFSAQLGSEEVAKLKADCERLKERLKAAATTIAQTTPPTPATAATAATASGMEGSQDSASTAKTAAPPTNSASASNPDAPSTPSEGESDIDAELQLLRSATEDLTAIAMTVFQRAAQQQAARGSGGDGDSK